MLWYRNKIYILCLFIVALCANPLLAGDIPYFLNLGFSENSSVFMFGQYGIDQESSNPYAESYIVDVKANTFVPDGTAQFVSDAGTFPGEDGLGALLNLLHQQTDSVSRYDINHLQRGRLVYLLVNGDEPKRSISFRDFNTGASYTLKLSQSSRGTKDAPEAAFHITLNKTAASGERGSQSIGLPDYYRKNVSSYIIKQVLISPDETSIIVVVEKVLDTENGRHLRYMVETAQLYN